MEVTVVEKDGNKVLQKMLAVRPQVVLLDAFMPGLDALAVKQRYNAAGERHTSFFRHRRVPERGDGAGAAGRRLCLLFRQAL